MVEETSASTSLERKVIAIVSAVQFVNIIDFMMVMPLGPDFAKDLGIRVSHLGVVSGSYTLAAAVSGLLCSFFIDRLDRRRALLISVLGLAFGTGAGAFAFDFHSLLWARVLAGLFGGPAAATSLAMISDVIPHQRRGKAFGTVMMAFSFASIFGVPAGLELARLGTWQTPFLVVAALGAIVALIVLFALPSMTDHLKHQDLVTPPWVLLKKLVVQPPVITSFVLTFGLMMSGFLIFPNFAPFFEMNLGFPRDQMGRLYLVGGLVSFAVMRICGVLVDRFGTAPLFVLGSMGFIFGLFAGFYFSPPLVGVYGIFTIFMLFGTIRNISSSTLTSKVPKPEERAGFMSIQSAVQHAATAAGGILSSRLLVTSPEGLLDGVENVVFASASIALLAVAAVFVLQRLVTAHEH